MKPRLLRETIVLVAMAAASSLAQAVLVEPEAQPLFLNAPPGSLEQAKPASVYSKRSRLIQLNPRLFKAGRGGLQQPGSRWRANLFPDTETIVSVVRTEVKEEGRFVSIGHAEDVPGSQMILAAADGVVAGSLTLPGLGVFQLECAGSGLHWVNEMDLSRRPRCGMELRNQLGLAAPLVQPSDALADGVAVTKDDDGRINLPRPLRPMGDEGPESEPEVVDFLVIYTAKALEGAGGEAGIQALVDYFITEANAAYTNSQINLRWNIVHQGPTAYTDSGKLGMDLDWLSRDPGVASMQSAYAADLVMMIVELEEAGWAGMATANGTVFVRSLVSAGLYIVPHEIGHVLGASHDRLNCQEYGDCGGKYPYSYGHRFVAEKATYTTIMSYRPGVHIPYFSNPGVFFLGSPTGVAEGATNAADNARTINQEAAHGGQSQAGHEPALNFTLRAMRFRKVAASSPWRSCGWAMSTRPRQ